MRLSTSVKIIATNLSILIINFACLGFAFYNNQTRGLINIDYLLSIFFIKSKSIFVIYTAFVSATDFFIIFAKSYNFTPVSFFENWKMLGLISFKYNQNLIYQLLVFLYSF
jgi:hypothetical protein